VRHMREVLGTGDFNARLEKSVGRRRLEERTVRGFSDCGQLRSVVAVCSDLIF
jgi:hypothetical protein